MFSIRLSKSFASVTGDASVFSSVPLRSDSRERPINYMAGLPDPTVLPYQEISASMENALTAGHTEAFASLSYSSPFGVQQLRKFVASFRRVRVDNVLITAGAMEAVFLSATATINRGDHVLVENPTFPQCVRIFERLGAVVEGIPVTNTGLDIEEVERKLSSGRRYAAIYTIPDFQNPTGSLAGAESKSVLLTLAARYGVPVIADNPYQELWFNAKPAPFPQEFRGSDGTPLFEIGSFSKWLGPGLRVGWIIADENVIQRLAAYRLGVDGGLSSLTQYALVTLLENNEWVNNTLSFQRRLYAVKAAALTQAIRDQLGSEVEFHEPQGGYFLWARFPRWFSFDKSTVQAALIEENINPVRGDVFFVQDSQANVARFSFAHAPVQDLVEGVNRLRNAMNRLRPHPCS